MTKSPIIVDLNFTGNAVNEALETAFADRTVINLADPAHDEADLSGIDYALVWKAKPALFSRARDLKIIFSGGAGVDHILALPGLPEIPLVRFVDDSLTNRMSEWVVMQCLMHLRQVRIYEAQRATKLWQELPQPEARQVTVGIMGLGELGQDVARKLKVMGFDVIGWSRRPKVLDGIPGFFAGGFNEFLSRTDILVGLLPLTPETTGIFNLDLFKKLRKKSVLGKPVFVNAGRGASQVEADIVTALNKGILGGASLDVFETEPLPAESPLWSDPRVFITPHAAAASNTTALFDYVERQIERYESGDPLEHLVNRDAGY